jgi:hypothetical protein
MATVGLVPTVFGSLMNITGATLATFWRDTPPGAARIRMQAALIQPSGALQEGTG